MSVFESIPAGRSSVEVIANVGNTGRVGLSIVGRYGDATTVALDGPAVDALLEALAATSPVPYVPVPEVQVLTALEPAEQAAPSSETSPVVCGRPATTVVEASSGSSLGRDYYACGEHTDSVIAGIEAAGLTAFRAERIPTPGRRCGDVIVADEPDSVAYCPGCGAQLPENSGCQNPGCGGIPPAPAPCGQPATRAVVAYPIPYGLRIHTHFTCADHFEAAVAGIEAAGLLPRHGPGIVTPWGSRCGDVTSRDGGEPAPMECSQWPAEVTRPGQCNVCNGPLTFDGRCWVTVAAAIGEGGGEVR